MFPRAFEFRRTDGGAVYRFELDAAADRSWKRTDLDLWCRYEEAEGWGVVDASGTIFARPLAPVPAVLVGPPQCRWLSCKDGKSYEYELAWLD